MPTRFVSGGDFHFFNGRWGPRGRDRNTTSVYHNRLTDEVHARVAERHLLSAPEMACSDEAADVNRHAERQFRNWQRYFDETNRTRHAYCSLAEPRYLGSDAAKVPYAPGSRVLTRPRARRGRGAAREAQAVGARVQLSRLSRGDGMRRSARRVGA